MNSRERVLVAINHCPPDRVPIDLNLTLAAYEKLKRHLGLHFDDKLRPNLAMEVIPHPQFLAELGVDIISVKFPSAPIGTDGLPQKQTDAWGLEYMLIQQEAGAYYEVANHPLSKANISDLDNYPWPSPPSHTACKSVHDEARQFYEHTELALMGRFGAPILETAGLLLGMEEWYIRLLTDQEFIRVLLDHITDVAIAQDMAGLEASARYLQIVKISGEDFGAQNGPLYSMETFRELLLPPLRRRWNAVRTALTKLNPEAKIMLHSCGGIRPFIPDLIASGIDILDPVQPMAAGMEAAGLHTDFGSRLVFHGAVDVQKLLPYSLPTEIATQVRQTLSDFEAHCGGLILAPSHNVQADVPPRSLMTMLETARQWRNL